MRARAVSQCRMTAGGITLLLAAIAVLVFLSALFSGLETALFSLKAHQLRRLEEEHPSLKQFIEGFRDNPRRILSVLLLGDALTNVPLIILCLFLVWEGPLAANRIPQWLAAIGIFAVVVLLCDLIPKLVALSAPYRLSAVGVLTLRTVMPLLGRVGEALESVSDWIVHRIAPASALPRRGVTDEQLETLVEMGEEEGALQEAEGEMIQEIIKLGDKTAKDCMTPRVDTFALPDDLTNEEAIEQIRAKRHRRVPVYSDTPDQIAGILDVKQFLLDPAEHYTEQLVAPSFVPETMAAIDLLRSFLSHPQGLAIVVDEFGGTEGIITLSDIVEEIMSDAAPLGQADLYIEPLDDGRFLVSGNARLDDLTEHLGFELEADGIDTIGGFVFNRLGYLPPSGTRVELPRLLITVRRTARKRVEELLLEKTAWLPDDDTTEEDGAEEGDE
ncbi:MAG: hemolysin family protein [Verrucomicrobiota bacterium]|nr:hemolysin family protein [Verrucomicrobiota bacterium]